ncbi:acyltransferase family protein [Pelosinus baikalensis]|uniref:Acyltransferase family protein n=1 Tax=Pelosinus baikalensis TaxID=2892015 RepID=A0ABS8HMB5_9FIRM|nr:acyltransferase family protein [Pelosinus baikalensis]MCC5464082.1 acyltransferase family protein [Pelosinus baikalensis]
MSKQRNVALDIGKGIAIALMVIGHLEHYLLVGPLFFSLQKFIFIFHMPFFFFVSGFTFAVSGGEALKPFIIKRIRSLILPWIIWSMVFLCILLLEDPQKVNVPWMIKEIFINGTFMGGWFIPCLFWSQIFLAILVLITKRKDNLLLPALLFIGILGMYLPELMPITFYKYFHRTHHADVALVSTLLAGVGYLYKKINYESLTLACAASILVGIAFFFNSRADMNMHAYGNKVLFLAGALSGSYLILFIAKLVERYSSYLTQFLAMAGRNSLWILFFHETMLLHVDWLLGINKRVEVSGFIYVLYAILPLVLSPAIMWLLDNSRVKLVYCYKMRYTAK